MFVNDICIGLLQQCNWNCRYCIASKNVEAIDEVAIFKELFPIRHKLEKLWISGGEPGLLSETFWHKLYSSIDFSLKICTNGTFITNGLYDIFKNRVHSLAIHCVNELDQDIDKRLIQAVKEDKTHKIILNIVVHRHNTHMIKDFLTKYKDLGHIHINFTDQTFADITDKDYDYVIDRKAAENIVKQLGSFPGYNFLVAFIVKGLINNKYDNLNPWSPKNIDPSQSK